MSYEKFWKFLDGKNLLEILEEFNDTLDDDIRMKIETLDLLVFDKRYKDRLLPGQRIVAFTIIHRSLPGCCKKHVTKKLRNMNMNVHLSLDCMGFHLPRLTAKRSRFTLLG